MFFFLLLSTCTNLGISASRPITGSRAPCSARSTSSMAYKFNASKTSDASSTPAAFAAFLVARGTDSIVVPALGMHFLRGLVVEQRHQQMRNSTFTTGDLPQDPLMRILENRTLGHVVVVTSRQSTQLLPQFRM